ncbi:MAG TPA: saccharopine dehydrogenase NADP-binding domain-containing protein [Pseudonocardiaceae bacterium]|jgi:short subunit dehydrogenase-like uncharacterized protein|nr:saccharopine dehydrogenase NADP-binding domain-containing protein [Pseudonocardiaceae bacterium]
MNEIWIIGATGRIGRAMARQLAASHPLALIGRDQARLRALADEVGGECRTIVAASPEAVIAEFGGGAPAVLVNLVGPFARTGVPIAKACPPGTHYVDLANELTAVTHLLGLHDDAATAGRTIVTGAGFGVLGTESVVLKLCADRATPPERVRVDAIALIDSGPDQLGTALAGTVLDVVATGGRRYANGRLVGAGFGCDPELITLPDGTTAKTGGAPSGELEAARRASRAPFVVAASAEAPSSPVVRAILPAVAALLSVPALRRAAQRRLAKVTIGGGPRTRLFSWAHARVQDRDGSSRDGWLRAPEGMEFTVSVAVEVTSRLCRGEGKPGAYTPGALFGPELAEQAGGEFIVN